MAEVKFPTEVVDLPSKGLLYPEGSPLSTGKIEIKYMTAKEEDILTSPNLIKQGVVVEKLLESLIVDKSINVDDLLIGDKNSILIASRILAYGKEYEVEVDGRKIEVDLTALKDIPLDESIITKGANEFEFELPNSKRKITFMAMTESRERKVKHQVEAQKKANRKLKDMTSRELTTRMKNMILSVDGSDEQKDINHFVDNELFAVDSKALRAYINESVPDIDLTFEFVSEETGEEREMQLPMDVGFFWPSE